MVENTDYIQRRQQPTIVYQVQPEHLKAVIREVMREMFEEHRAAQADPFSEYPELLTTSQVAEILQVTRSTVSAYAADPMVELVRFDMNGKPRYAKADVLKLFKVPIKGKRLQR